jgi:hypothetical protein
MPPCALATPVVAVWRLQPTVLLGDARGLSPVLRA